KTQVALELAEPAGETAGIGECRPQVVDIGVVAVFHAHDALAIGCAQAAEDAVALACVAGHLVLLRSRFPRAISVCRASSRCSHKARYRLSHSSISATGARRRLWTRRCASWRNSTKPASRSTRRCRDTPGRAIGSSAASSPAVAGPPVNASSTVRRLSSASARSTASTPRMYQDSYVTIKVHKRT